MAATAQRSTQQSKRWSLKNGSGQPASVSQSCAKKAVSSPACLCLHASAALLTPSSGSWNFAPKRFALSLLLYHRFIVAHLCTAAQCLAWPQLALESPGRQWYRDPKAKCGLLSGFIRLSWLVHCHSVSHQHAGAIHFAA